jgi:hypothetical protein
MDPGVQLAERLPHISVGVYKPARPPLKRIRTSITWQRIVEQFVCEGSAVLQIIAIVAVRLRPKVNSLAPPVP